MSVTGIWAAALTPVTHDLQPDSRRAIPYLRGLLANGCDGVNVLGTTGEAMSFGADQRERYVRELADSGLPPDQMMAGTGAASLDDAARLTKAALECGFAAALVMPPFFFRDASDDGVAAFFEALIARVAPPPRSLLYYNFPRMSGIALHARLADRLIADFGEHIFGMKDSSNDAQLQREIAARHPSFAILPGSESDLLDARARGAAGCISGSVALWARLAKDVFESGDRAKSEELRRNRAALDGLPLVPVMKHLTAALRSDPEWERPMPPQERLSAQARETLARRGLAREAAT
ncbi:MAG TPA: dihydrodipicolinate synthase family protein [Candidatus Cybelea sp.]|jgi:4-hydroxy-tetrahydrodipicolinate synthase|nr:dihydrodipicolinate synthase family protein [Candidatus Cybelea sp.]